MRLEDIKIQNEVPDVISFINNLFDSAIQENASDIHIEPTRLFLLFRFRKDGDFLLKHRIWLDNSSAIVTRLKVMAKLKIDENKKPQDGKIVYSSERLSQTIDIRTATLPVTYGEKIVMRILKQDATNISLESVGFYEENLVKVREVLKSKYGIILVAWPTGSWKSTTLFSILKNFNPLEANISTLEDPVEYDMEFINQSQIRPDIWYTFASGLRSLVRQDPDIIMVWEIRDKETAALSIEAALTWHLVLSTIHTNTAAATVQRLINMWVEPFLIASALKMVISQRLVKKICPHCRVKYNLSELMRNKLKSVMGDLMDTQDIESLEFFKGIWCDKCSQTGYSWRLAVHEILVLWEYMESYILRETSASEIQKIAMEHGMITLLQDSIVKAAKWQTTLEEAFKLL